MFFTHGKKKKLFFHMISQVEEKTKKLRKIFLKKCFIQYDVKKKILKNVSLKK